VNSRKGRLAVFSRRVSFLLVFSLAASAIVSLRGSAAGHDFWHWLLLAAELVAPTAIVALGGWAMINLGRGSGVALGDMPLSRSDRARVRLSIGCLSFAAILAAAVGLWMGLR
jgi:hypothetical protein